MREQAAVGDVADLVRGHTQECQVVRQELTADRDIDGQAASEDQRRADDSDQRQPVADRAHGQRPLVRHLLHAQRPYPSGSVTLRSVVTGA